MSWELLLTTFLGSGASFTLISLLFEHRKHRRERIESVSFLALRLAVLLEGYALRCVDEASDHSIAKGSGGHAGTLLGAVPITPTLPDSDSYRLLDKALLHLVLEFPQRRDIAQQEADFWSNVVGDRDCYLNTAWQNTLLIGAHSLDVARRLRDSHSLPRRSLTFGQGRDLGKHLAEQVQSILTARKQSNNGSSKPLGGSLRAPAKPEE